MYYYYMVTVVVVAVLLETAVTVVMELKVKGDTSVRAACRYRGAHTLGTCAYHRQTDSSNHWK